VLGFSLQAAPVWAYRALIREGGSLSQEPPPRRGPPLNVLSDSELQGSSSLEVSNRMWRSPGALCLSAPQDVCIGGLCVCVWRGVLGSLFWAGMLPAAQSVALCTCSIVAACISKISLGKPCCIFNLEPHTAANGNVSKIETYLCAASISRLEGVCRCLNMTRKWQIFSLFFIVSRVCNLD